MSPTNLQGLNLIPPTQPADSFPADSHDSQDLLNLSYYPELSAQLDIWTNLAFQSDEPLAQLNDKKSGGDEATHATQSVEDDEEDDPDDGQPAQADNHDNVVMANPDPVPPRPTQPRTATRPLTAFDIGSLLAGFGVDSFVPPVQSTAATPSLAQILSLYPNAAYPPPPASVSGEDDSQPTAKRARVRRPSAPGTSDHTDDSGTLANEPLNNTPLTPAEDKRRRNTAASARFRLKKKEREAALEKKSKELEMRVTELERECEGLRRENGWLKGLVVGVTGVGASQQAASASAGVKRPRDDVDGVGK
ncbi:hypothetical protein DFH94DRAFT_728085 [Russula ochroleuca]|jgi:hypothetical protein|uniref:BZIP domain-containing protein n=1 Tax=Russula ochroleuca TaxID=152965 RepID=A0A9P5MZD8_9AGAM|nr:hypothetical protein DFH94DRAFT_728085 [Russula ochroleuca]